MLHVVMKNSSKWPMVPSTYSKIFRSNVRKIRTLEDLEKISFFFKNVFVRFVLQFSSEKTFLALHHLPLIVNRVQGMSHQD